MQKTLDHPPPEEQPETVATMHVLDAFWGLGQALKCHAIPILEREHGVDFKDFIALSAIERGAHYPRLMCERMGITASNVSKMLEDLTRHELVRREIDPEDSRRVRLEITSKGFEVLSAARQTMLALLETGLGALTEAQVRSFSETMVFLADRLTEASTTVMRSNMRSNVLQEVSR